MKNALSYYTAKLSKIRCCIFFMSIFLPALASAQTRGTVQVIKDPLIDTLMARRPSLNKGGAITGGEETSNGYRVQIFFGSSRQAAYDAQAKFNEEYPELRTYIIYNEPNFKVRAGDFRTRLEAQKLVQEIRPMFSSLFIIPEKINPPKTDPSND
ncbi:SPOR domain-containing protein [Mucilaginibacter sp.]|uniref:SPOR domain-containing protein n=1 Tax=Mucilaginibacter sp. TaxID=1882438 RepID=UPI002609B929|nr:SPOR domain-containing protein [Mucilaginibacter sp.]